MVEKAIKDKKAEPVGIDAILRLYEERKELRQKIEEVSRERKVAADARNVEEGKRLKDVLQPLGEKLAAVEKEFVQLMIKIPNIPSPDTPIGPDESANKVLRSWGEKPKFKFTPKEHWELGKELGVINTEKAGEISGPRFSYILGDLVHMQYALLKFGFETLTNEDTLKTIAEEAGLSISTKPFVPVLPPVMMKSAVMNRMARLQPIEERYFFEKDDIVLVGSAEHTLGPLHMDEIIDEKDLPIRYVGYSTAFRREAGSYGKDTRGILRQHQFDKLEMETFCLPENSMQEQDFLVAIQEHLLKSLKLPYQVVLVCTGDMGFPDYRQIDIETWMPGQKKYRETHSADLTTSFQSRRLNTRVRRADSKVEPLHMNDATAVALGRTLIAIMENYQEEDGSIKIPEVLQQYMGGQKVIEKKV